MNQIEFNKFNLWCKEDKKRFCYHQDRQIANMYLKPPHGLGMSEVDIVKLLHVSQATIKNAIIKMDKKLWRTMKEGIGLAGAKKVAAWADPASGYNTSDKVLCKRFNIEREE